MAPFGKFTAKQFVDQYWQSEPVLVRDSGCPLPSVSAAELLALACEPDVESRLVVFEDRESQWRCEYGPFTRADLEALPARGWTLLLQAVDQWRADVASLKQAFDFLPSWRLDDIMISVADEGGGVGPHFDSYDVFLLQLSGTRDWQVGQRCDATTSLLEHPDLKLMADFQCHDSYALEPGDMLYVPPGVAHWGTATSAGCVTCSIGFRAPAYTEVAQQALALLEVDEVAAARFRDRPGEASDDPYLISPATVEHIEREWLRTSAERFHAALPEAFGRQVTEPRYAEFIESRAELSEDIVERRWLQSGCVVLTHNRASRFAYRLDGDGAQLFVDGEAYSTTRSFARGVCHGRLGDLEEPHELALLLLLATNGSVSVE